MGVAGGYLLKEADAKRKDDHEIFGAEKKKMVDSQYSIPMGIFFSVFFSVVYYLLTSWREKIRNSTPLHAVTMTEMAAIITFLASCVYLLGFFGMSFVQATPEEEEEEEEVTVKSDVESVKQVVEKEVETIVSSQEDEEVIRAVVSGKTPSYSLESKLGDCKRAAFIRRVALERITGKSLDGLPLEGLDYESILGQCCEMPVGYVQIPVGIAGPLLLDGKEFSVPMATTEGCLVL